MTMTVMILPQRNRSQGYMLVCSFIPFDVSLVSFNIESDPHVSWLIVMNITILFNGDIDDNNLDDDYNDDDGDGDDDDKYDICEPGLVFLVYRGETKRALLPNEVSFIDTVKALFVRLDSSELSRRSKLF